jgi:lipopolysaccharide biosynthesis protein
MSLPPAWKVKRELRRIASKFEFRVTSPFVDRLRQNHHDRNLSRLLRETPGQLPLTARVAVFVLFQPKGIAASTFLTLNHMAQEGWSVLVVSNTPLSDADRASLAQHSAHVIERPNTGYDFGAYREGWRWLDRNGHKPDWLILMNDSTWFPLRMEDDSLRRMVALNADLAGHIFKTEKANDRGHDHVEAHLLMFSPHALGHPAVRRFWAEYLMSNSKDKTIAKGEKGITDAVRSAGLSV